MSHGTSDPLNILIVGGGGREHALAWHLRQSPLCARLFCAPGNPGIALARTICLPIAAMDFDRLLSAAAQEHIDLVVIGPEAPLQAGLTDALFARFGDRLAVFGCSARAALIESSKVFAKGFMDRHGIPTAAHAIVHSPSEAGDFLDRHRYNDDWVVKADGLRAGKGVTLCQGRAQVMEALGPLVQTDGHALIEERLLGREVTLMALCDGESVLPLPACEDHKTLLDGDLGPMTGGMGAICPSPLLFAADRQPAEARADRQPAEARAVSQIAERILLPAARGLVAEGRSFHGLLYAGLMLTAQGPRVLEFNCRFGDPEAQALVMALDNINLLPLLHAVGRRRLAAEPQNIVRPGKYACAVVLAAAGYPGPPRTGDLITGLDLDDDGDPPVGPVYFHAGTAWDRPFGPLRTAGGRVLAAAASAAGPAEARKLAYQAAAKIHFPGVQMRADIGAR